MMRGCPGGCQRPGADLYVGRRREAEEADLRWLAAAHPLHEHVNTPLMLARNRCGQNWFLSTVGAATLARAW